MAQNYDSLVINRSRQTSESVTDSDQATRPAVNPYATRPKGSTQPTSSQDRNSTMPKTRSKSAQNQLLLWAIPAGLLIVSFLLGYFWVFKPATYVVQEPETTEVVDTGLLSLSGPADQACPLNGKLFTQAERDAWETRRPLAVMVENSIDARPQSGLADADIVYEAVAEGGITRFMPIFYCGAQAEEVIIAPVRSARTYFVNLASGYNYPLYAHVGGANEAGPTDALGQINDYGWGGQNDLNQFSLGYPTFVRNYNRLDRTVATEHTMETTSEELWKAAEKRGWTNMSPSLTMGRTTIPASDWQDDFVGWTFVDGSPSSSPTASKIDYGFWTGQPAFAVSWDYDPTTNTYLRSQGGEKHVDLNTNEQIVASNVVFMKTKEEGPLNSQQHMMYHVIGTGDAIIFKDGNSYEVTWTKKERESELEFKDAQGKKFEFNRGLIWVSVTDKDNKPTYN